MISKTYGATALVLLGALISGVVSAQDVEPVAPPPPTPQESLSNEGLKPGRPFWSSLDNMYHILDDKGDTRARRHDE